MTKTKRAKYHWAGRLKPKLKILDCGLVEDEVIFPRRTFILELLLPILYLDLSYWREFSCHPYLNPSKDIPSLFFWVSSNSAIDEPNNVTTVQ